MVRQQASIRDVMDQFVLVRLTRAESFDLSLFQFDLDQSFAVFFINADRTIYGRYGTRSDFYEADRDISLAGLKLAMERALVWHQDFAAMRPRLLAKRNPDPKYKNFGDIPTSGRSGYRRGSGESGGRCVHCHNLRTAEHKAYLATEQVIPDEILYAWPMPDVLGLKFDPQQALRVAEVREGSTADQAGIQLGDEIIQLANQPLLSVADLQWVLQNAAAEAELPVVFARGESQYQGLLQLQAGWRHQGDISWRTTSRELRDILLDGILFEEISQERREQLGLASDKLALEAVRGIGRNANKPLRRGDIVVEINGASARITESQLIALFAQKLRPGDAVELTVLRDGKQVAVVQQR